MHTGIMIVFALLLVGLNAFFVAAEFAFVKVRKTQLDLLAAAGNRRAKIALFGVTHLDAYLSVCQLGITLASLGLGWIGEPAVARALRPVFAFFSVTSPTVVTTLSVAVGFTLITLIHVVFGELAPKSISIQKAEATVLLLSPFMRFFYMLCLPLVTVMNGISNGVLRMVGISPAGEAEHSHSPEELRMMILDSSKRGRMDKEEGRMLDNIFSFYQKSAKDIMIHRMDTMALNAETSREKALELAHESGHTRFPIYEENRDNIIGFIHIKDLLRKNPAKNLRPILRAPLYAHETLHLDRLLRRMQNKRQQFCVVIDEYGIWQGILTMEDIVEAIVGDIQDEFDNETPDVMVQADGSYRISGDISLDDLADYIPLECADPSIDMYKIIAAHFIDAFDRIPEQGDTIERCGKRFTVMTMERNRMRSVRVEPVDSNETLANLETAGETGPKGLS